MPKKSNETTTVSCFRYPTATRTRLVFTHNSGGAMIPGTVCAIFGATVSVWSFQLLLTAYVQYRQVQLHSRFITLQPEP